MKNELRKYIRSVISENAVNVDKANGFGQWVTNSIDGVLKGVVTKEQAVQDIVGYAQELYQGTTHLMKMPNMNETAVEIDEERLTNEEGQEFVKRKENFIASHCWGERLGDGSYIVASYGKQFPIYIFWNKKNRWYENDEPYIFNAEPQESTEEHKQDLRPTDETIKKSADWMKKLSAHLLKLNRMEDYSHISVEPGTKN